MTMPLFRKYLLLLLTIACTKIALAQQPAPARERLSLDKGWLFHLGDVPFSVPKTHDQTYNDSKAGTASGAASVKYKDSAWQPVTLPHDWAIEGGFDSTQNVSEGYRIRGIGWYRRAFKLPVSDK